MGNSLRSHRVVPVFVGGTGRSGTTVIGDLLANHSRIRTSTPIEIKFLTNRSGLVDVVFGYNQEIEKKSGKVSILNFRTYRKRKRKEKERFAKIFAEFNRFIWEKWWDIDAPPPHGRGLISGISKSDLEVLLSRLDRELKLNPLFINMVRDPRDVIASLLTKKWGPTTPFEGLDWIEKRLLAGHEALSVINPAKKITIALEDLAINSREQTYNKLLTFLKISDEPAMQKFFVESMTPDAATSGRWKAEIDSPEFSAGFEEMKARLSKSGVYV